MFENIQERIDEKYLVRDKSSSDGSQIKYYMDKKWYKVDYFGGEGESEYLASLLLSCTNLDKEKYVMYSKASINGTSGCVSLDFRQDEADEFVTLIDLKSSTITNVVGKMFSKSFSPDFKQNYKFLSKHCTIKLDRERIARLLEKHDNTPQKQVLEYQLQRMKNICS